MDSTFLIISLLVNVLLGTLLFFKSSLNEILTNLWKSKQTEKKEQKERLIRLRTLFTRLSTISFRILLKIAMWQDAKNPGDSDLINSKTLANFDEWKEINDTIVENELYLPVEIRNLYKSFTQKIKTFNGEIINHQVSIGPRLLEMGNEVDDIINKMINKIENEISKY